MHDIFLRGQPTRPDNRYCRFRFFEFQQIVS
jgi:hypothetical protein